MKLGLRGITVMAATGDTGVQGAAQQGGSPASCNPFLPVFPASSPYVTAVGGTQFSFRTAEACWTNVYSLGTASSIAFACPDQDVGEITCSADTGAMITTGGGFSNRFAMPEYQKKHVARYLELANSSLTTGFLPPESHFNASGRAYPDMAAIGQNVPVVFDGELQMTGGTSASTPILAGLVALINGKRLQKKMKPMGFLNPWLYHTHSKDPSIVTDVKYGNNSGGNRLLPTYASCEYGFNAIPGWDAATGLGSPYFSKMLQQAMLTDPVSSSGDGDGSSFSWKDVGVAAGSAVLGAVIAVAAMMYFGKHHCGVQSGSPPRSGRNRSTSETDLSDKMLNGSEQEDREYSRLS